MWYFITTSKEVYTAIWGDLLPIVFFADPTGAESSISQPSVASTSLSSISMNPPGQPSSWSQDKPTLREIFRILLPIAHEWANIGTLLDLSPDQLSNIKHDNDGAQNCLREMVILWLKCVTIRPTWQSLADAVSFIDQKTALKISETYMQNS